MKRNKPVTQLRRSGKARSVPDPQPVGQGQTRNRETSKKQRDSEAAPWSPGKDFRTFHDLACAVTTDLDFPTVARQALSAISGALSAERAILFLGRGDNSGLVPAVVMNVQGDEILALEHIGRTVLRSVQHGEVVSVDDATTDPRLRAIESARLNQMRSILCAGLMSPNGIVGAVYLDAPSPGPSVRTPRSCSRPSPTWPAGPWKTPGHTANCSRRRPGSGSSSRSPILCRDSSARAWSRTASADGRAWSRSWMLRP